MMNDGESCAWPMKWVDLELRAFTGVMLAFLVATWLDGMFDGGATQVLDIAAMPLACAVRVWWTFH